MPRRRLRNLGSLVWHVMNRAIQDVTLFSEAREYDAFVRTLAEATERFAIELFAYCVMPNHWHLVVRADAGTELSPYMKWLTATHAERWRAASGTAGRGAVYQGRFRGVPVEADLPFLRVCRYVERNAVAAGLVDHAEAWRWSSASTAAGDGTRPVLSPWPVSRPRRWPELLNRPQDALVVEQIRLSLVHGVPYGAPEWRDRLPEAGASRYRGRGRPRGVARSGS